MSSVFKIYSPEDCDFYYDGELQGHIEGKSKKAFRFEVERKGMSRLVFINSEYQTELITTISIDADEEREVELDFSEVNEPVIQERERIIIAIEHDYGGVKRLPEEIISAISKNGIVTIPQGVKKIGNCAFYSCSSLTSITIPDSVTEIGDHAFSACSSLTSITIPNSVNKIGNSAFSACYSLTAFYGKYASYDNRCLIKDGRLLAFAPCDITKYSIPNGITEIEYRAFSACSSLTSITIPDSVTEIGGHAFSACSRLTSITIPDSVTEIGDHAFSACSGLTAFYGKYASYDNRCLIKDGRLLAFAPYNITTYSIPDGVIKIKRYAFSFCRSLTSVTIPDSVTEIEAKAFFFCRNLTAFYGKYASYDNRCLIKDGRLLAVAPYDITKYSIPNGVTKIEENAFSCCRSLTSVTIPDSVTEIGDRAFNDCRSLTSVTIPNSVTEIGFYAFYGCRSLTSVYFKSTTPPNIVTWREIFRKDLKIFVPKSADSAVLKAYEYAGYFWEDYKFDFHEYDIDYE